MNRIAITQLNELFKRIDSSLGNVVLPVKKAGVVNFDVWHDQAEVAFNVLKTSKSPKDYFFPQSETLMKFRYQGKKISIEDVRDDHDPFVLFGIKACDLQSFDVLDRVFLHDPVDTFYQARREAGIVVSLACSKPDESCFCTTFGIDPSAPKGDVTTYLVGEYLYWQANTEKGNLLTEKVADLLEECESNEVDSEKSRIKAILPKLPLSNLSIDKIKALSTDEMFNSAKWAELSSTCMGCGSCTFVCPTCQCFDIKDFNTPNGTIRYRCWDSCMYSEFTQMAGGNNRTTQLQRYRQRFMHKLKYYPENNDGLFSCVGCGRCVKKCPQHLNIVKVIKSFGGENND